MNTLFSSRSAPSTAPLHPAALTSAQAAALENTSLETHVGSVLVFTEDGTLIYATENLPDRLKKLMASAEPGVIPQEILLICQMLKQCRSRFPSQNWAMEFDIFTKDAIALRIRSRWLKLEGFAHPCILLIVEDHQQMVQDIVLDEVQGWGLTPREQEVWLHHQAGCTYHQIAEQLFITINTVKKHMRSVHAKRRAQDTAG
ncbi:MAG: helix-turn-helix transcriptional regulator [Leptolyngbyaceae cyanobacterium]